MKQSPVLRPKTVSPNSKYVTLLGFLRPKEDSIPVELRGDEGVGVDVGVLIVTTSAGVDYALDRSGINFAIPTADLEEIIQIARDNCGFVFKDSIVVPVLKGEGRHKSQYRLAESETITRYIASIPALNKRLLKGFTSRGAE